MPDSRQAYYKTENIAEKGEVLWQLAHPEPAASVEWAAGYRADMSDSFIDVRPIDPGSAGWVEQYINDRWAAPLVIAHGVAFDPHQLPGYVASIDGARVGLATYHIDHMGCEIITLDSDQRGIGVGSALICMVEEAAEQAGCSRLWLITSNDNLPALGFYQRRGFELVAVHRRAIEQARQLKPQIPYIGFEGIPIRDEIELELPLPKQESDVAQR